MLWALVLQPCMYDYYKMYKFKICKGVYSKREKIVWAEVLQFPGVPQKLFCKNLFIYTSFV